MYTFSLYGYLIIAAAIILCIFILLYFHKRTSKKSPADFKTGKVWGATWMILGLILFLMSIIFFIKVQYDITQTLPIFRPIAEMTSEPVLLLTIIAFFAGITLFLCGLFYLKSGSKTVPQP
ncbi:hypothetical protein JXQ31_01265 [candidate division KSB1 bacterium]|nr:hypothetical protein [candidate division KSB1 bacterium]